MRCRCGVLALCAAELQAIYAVVVMEELQCLHGGVEDSASLVYCSARDRAYRALLCASALTTTLKPLSPRALPALAVVAEGWLRWCGLFGTQGGFTRHRRRSTGDAQALAQALDETALQTSQRVRAQRRLSVPEGLQAFQRNNLTSVDSRELSSVSSARSVTTSRLQPVLPDLEEAEKLPVLGEGIYRTISDDRGRPIGALIKRSGRKARYEDAVRPPSPIVRH